MLDDQQFDMFSVAYGGGGPFPLPMQFFHSAQADQKASTNITGFKDKRADEILALYDKELDVKKRAELLRELDGIVAAQHHYLLEWSAPYERMVYWNKFGQPKGTITRIGDYRDPPGLWWFDPQKNQELEQALRDPSRKLAVGAPDDKYWLEFAKIEETQIRPDVTSYFLRRLLLIVPTFIGITMAAFVVMHFVPGGPIERQIMAYKMAVAQEGGGGRPRPVRDRDFSRRTGGDEEVLRLRQAAPYPILHVAMERSPSRSREGRTPTRIPSGTSSSRDFRSRFFLA